MQNLGLKTNFFRKI